jgi:hypothetical protein
MERPPTYETSQAESSHPARGRYAHDHVGYTPRDHKVCPPVVEAILLEPRTTAPIAFPIHYYVNHDTPRRKMILVIVIAMLLGLAGCLIGAIVITKHAAAATHSKIMRQVYHIS